MSNFSAVQSLQFLIDAAVCSTGHTVVWLLETIKVLGMLSETHYVWGPSVIGFAASHLWNVTNNGFHCYRCSIQCEKQERNIICTFIICEVSQCRSIAVNNSSFLLCYIYTLSVHKSIMYINIHYFLIL